MIDSLIEIVPDIDFIQGDNFCWSPSERKIIYDPTKTNNEGNWALLHETGHALLGHLSYKSDYELLKMEISAWEKAKDLAAKLGLSIDEEHIQQCLDSYRDWLNRRSTCPTCGTKALQKDIANDYSCFNCHTCWQVSPSRFCRSYRSRQPEKETIPF